MHYAFSAVSLGLAILSKESAIFFIPMFILAIVTRSHEKHRLFAITYWTVVLGFIVSSYFLFALLKGEFFPSGTFLGGDKPHVSLVETFQFQLSRKGGFFLGENSGFMVNFKGWVTGQASIPVPDPVLIIAGIASTLGLLLSAFWKRRLLLAALPALSYSFFLIRGGEVITFYVIPLIPLFGLTVGVLISYIYKLLAQRGIRGKFLGILFVILSLFPFGYYYARHTEPYSLNQTQAQIEAIEWISANIPADSKLLIDNYAYLEFHDKSPQNKYKLPAIAEYYWKFDRDPDVGEKIFNNDWQNVDYIISTPQVSYDAFNADLPLLRTAFENSTVLKSFEYDTWKVEILKVNKEENTLAQSWDYYKNHYISSDGRVNDPQSGRTTSEGQAYSLLRSVFVGDRETFDKVLDWTNLHLKRDEDSLYGWWYGKLPNGKEGLIDKGAATDADEDIATALILASKLWNDQSYNDLAKNIVSDIWDKETVQVNNKRYLVAGNWAANPRNSEFTLNPSYLSPFSYRLFSSIDPDHDWIQVVDSSYEVLQKCTELNKNNVDTEKSSNFLPPNWCAITPTGKIIPTSKMGDNALDYSADAIRIPWRLAMDYLFFKEDRAYQYLQNMNLWQSEWGKHGSIYAGYNHNGTVKDGNESLANYGTMLAFFKVTDPQISDQILKNKIDPQWNSEGYWGTTTNYYDQNIVWFGLFLYKEEYVKIATLLTK
jgi:endoglucanase